MNTMVIPRFCPDNLSYEQFYYDFMLANKPCIFDAKLTSNWRCTSEWINPESGAPDFEFLKLRFGECIVPVSDCRDKFYNSQRTENMSFSKYITYWQELIDSGHDFKGGKRCLYLKDWHFVNAFPEYNAYQVPEYFESDWLNEFWSTRTDINKKDDYRFVYMGPKGTSTPLHKDVYGSFSWSANICGRKKWIFFAPELEEELKAIGENGQLPYDLSDRLGTKEFDLLFNPVEIIQNPGEVIFVPSGWFHQVSNIEDTISINHNWYNACNLEFIWDSLQLAFVDVTKQLEDIRKTCDIWADECHTLLKAHYGMDHEEFISTCEVIVSRLECELEDQDNQYQFRVKHDIEALLDLLNKIFKICSEDSKSSVEPWTDMCQFTENFYDRAKSLSSRLNLISRIE